MDFFDVLLNRRTIRSCAPAKLEEILSLVRFVMLTRHFGEGKNLGRMRKVAISAGALHPVEVMVVAGPELTEPIVYLDSHDAFGTMTFRSQRQAQANVHKVMEMVPEAHGHTLLFVANQRHIAQAYENPESLIWRDAGAVMQTFAFVASARGLSFVPLGITGRSVLQNLPAPHADYVAAGMAIIGRAAAPTGDAVS